ncbi:MAG TPA: tryptophan synthase subunit alpha, partial [Polyangiaceae bacterium]
MTTERIDRCFAALKEQGRPALVAYLTIGDPDLDQCTQCALAALNSGVDLLELGVPFSDPTADGPVIAAASYRAIQRGGSLPAALGVAQRIRSQTNAPIVLFTYYNPVIAFGDERLPQAAVGAGIDGILVVDLPPEEGALLRSAAQRAELAVIPLVAPTTAVDREARVLQGARG